MSKRSSRREFLARGAAVVAAGFAPVGVTRLEADTIGSVGHVSHAGHAAGVPQPVRFGDVLVGGDLGRRMGQNFGRLQDDIYKPGALWRQVNWKSWPGDFEGRALLADTLLARATQRIPAYYNAMVGAYPAQLNEHGYFGPSVDGRAINEQQLSGHGWFLRALCEVYAYQKANAGAVQSVRPEQTLGMIRAIVRNMALPLRGKYAAYPIDPAARARMNAGWVSGRLTGQYGDWVVSSDTGCAFIFLDGLAHAWVVLKGAGAPEAAELKGLIDEAIERFVAMDLVAVKAQTHASLTGMRALLRVQAETGDAKLLTAVRDRYALYRKTAMTTNYANTNWFGRPQTWTEPCAVIDSFMVATQLWQRTDEASYLNDAQQIWFNGVGRGQRANGGFGTDTCAGFGTAWVKVRSYEAYFCCTMRGGEGFARAAQYLYFTRPGELTVPFYSNSDVTVDVGHGPLKLAQTTDYPYDGKVRIGVISGGGPMTLRLLAPEWTAERTLTLNGKPVATTVEDGYMVAKINPKGNDTLVLDQRMRLYGQGRQTATGMKEYYTLHAGPLLLGYKTPDQVDPEAAEMYLPLRSTKLDPAKERGSWTVHGTDTVVGRINDLNDGNAGPNEPCARQVLFRG